MPVRVFAVAASGVDDRYLVAAACIGATLLVLIVIDIFLRRAARKRPAFRIALHAIRRPWVVLVCAIVVRAVVPSLFEQAPGAVTSAATAVVALAAAWLVGALVLAVEDLVLLRYRTNAADNVDARRVQTQVSLIRRVTVAAVAVLACGAVLMSFPAVRALGASVLASAGVVGLVAALAAQSLLGNLFAGLNLAFGNALRLDDVVVVEGEWGRVEEMTLSYVVVKIWDERRLVLPTSYFTTTPFQNWTRSSAAVIGTVELDVDWTVPIAELRAEAGRIVTSSDLWDRRAWNLQITNAADGVVTVRVMVSAANSSALWDLRCLVREQLVVWLQERHPYALPRSRSEWVDARVPIPHQHAPKP